MKLRLIPLDSPIIQPPLQLELSKPQALVTALSNPEL